MSAPRPAARRALAQLLHFFTGSLLGLVVDLGLFAALVAAGVRPGLANVVSAAAAVVTVYAVVTRSAFAGGRSRRTFTAFVAWYAANIVVVSVVIDVLVHTTDWSPLACKLATLVPSFLANYAFSKVLFRSRPSAAGAPVEPALAGAEGPR